MSFGAFLWALLMASLGVALGLAFVMLAVLVLYVPIILLAGAFKHFFANDDHT